MKLCTKPYKGAIIPPTDYKQWDPIEQAKPPEIKLTPEYVHGYRSKDMRNNIQFTSSGSISYPTASMGVVYDFKTNNQQFYCGHKNDVSAFDISTDGKMAATGVLCSTDKEDKKPAIHVWNTVTMKLIQQFQGVLERGVELLRFSPSGDQLIGIGQDDNHSIVLYAITGKHALHLLVTQPSGKDILLGLAWKDDLVIQNGKKLRQVYLISYVTIGPKHLKEWKIEQDCKDLVPDQKSPIVEKSNLFLSASYNQGDLLVGDAQGNLQIWAAQLGPMALKKLHTKMLGAITNIQGYTITGGNDGVVNIISDSYTVIQRIEKSFFSESINPEIIAIAIIVGTSCSEIFNLSSTSGGGPFTEESKFESQMIMSSHYAPNPNYNETNGIAMFPNTINQFVTVSWDGTMRVWSMDEKKCIQRISLNTDENEKELPHQPQKQADKDTDAEELQQEAKGQCIAISPDESITIVGCQDGSIRVYNRSFQIINQIQIAKEKISCCQFSPNGKYLVCGSNDNYIYMFKMPNFYQPRILQKHSSFITHIGFTENSKYMHSTCGAYEILYWEVAKGKFLPEGAYLLRDERWQSYQVPLGWSVTGIFGKGYDGTDVNAIDRSHFKISSKPNHQYQLIATGNDFNEVSVFRYPTIKYGSHAVKSNGHSTPVSCVKFNYNDKKIISIGAEDQTIIQWNVQNLLEKTEIPSDDAQGIVEDPFAQEKEQALSEKYIQQYILNAMNGINTLLNTRQTQLTKKLQIDEQVQQLIEELQAKEALKKDINEQIQEFQRDKKPVKKKEEKKIDPDEEEIEVVYDPVQKCYYDPKTKLYYDIKV